MRRWFYVAIGGLVTLPAWMIGAVHAQSQLALTGLALLTFVSLILWNLAIPRKHRRRLRWNGLTLFLLGFLALTFLQWIPWPQSLLGLFSPESLKSWQQAFSLSGGLPASTWVPYSLAPGDTAVKVVRDLGFFFVFFAVFQWAHNRQHLTTLLQVMVVSAIALSALVLVQTALGQPNPLWGMYAPKVLPDGLLKGSPMINPNHFGGYLLLHAFFAFALLNDAHKEWQQYVWGGAGFLLSLMVLLTLSRGSILVFALGFVVFFLVMELLSLRDKARYQRELREQMEELEASGIELDDDSVDKPRRRRTPLFARLWKNQSTRYFLMVGCLTLCIGFYYASDALKKEFASTQFSLKKDKIAYIQEASGPLLKHFPRFGVGRGAQAMVWSRYSKPKHARRSQFIVSHVESLLLQPMVDWGITLGLLFLVLGGFLFLRLGWSLDHPLEAGAWLALFLLLLQNLGDFNLEFAGTAFPFVATLAVLSRLQLERGSRTLRLPSFLALGSGGLALLLLFFAGKYAWKHDYHRLKPTWKALASSPMEQLESRAKQLLHHHPSDYLLPLVVAQRLVRPSKKWKPQRALQWLERAQKLNPTAPDLFLLRGYIYARLGLGPESARAFGTAVDLRPRYLRVIVGTLRRYKMMKAAIQHSASTRLVSRTLERWLASRSTTKETLALAEQTRQRFPTSFEIYRVVGIQYINILSRKKDWKLQERLLWERKIASLITDMRRRFQHLKGFDLLLKARILEIRGQSQQAIRLYRQLYDGFSPDRWTAFSYLVPLLMKEGENQLLNLSFQVARQRFRLLWQRAQIAYLEGFWHEKQRRYRKALAAFDEATQIRALPQYSLARARVCMELAMYRCSLRVYQSLMRKKGFGHLKKKLKEVKIRMNRSQTSVPLLTP